LAAPLGPHHAEPPQRHPVQPRAGGSSHGRRLDTQRAAHQPTSAKRMSSALSDQGAARDERSAEVASKRHSV
jgi:hypothetical protein